MYLYECIHTYIYVNVKVMHEYASESPLLQTKKQLLFDLVLGFSNGVHKHLHLKKNDKQIDNNLFLYSDVSLSSFYVRNRNKTWKGVAGVIKQ